MQELIQKFSQTNLRAEIIEDIRVFRVDNMDIFAMDVVHDKRGEKFRIHLGSETNIINVIDIDPKMQQIVFRVQEPRRRFTQKVLDRATNKYKEKIRFTKPSKITYLAGMDETHLFVATMPSNSRITSIKDAHNVLMPPQVIEARKQRLKVKRQGEWFFIPIISNDEKELKELMELQPIRKNDILDKIDWRSKSHIVQYRIGNFVKGYVRHPDHHTLELKDWHKFIRNTEINGGHKFID